MPSPAPSDLINVCTCGPPLASPRLDNRLRHACYPPLHSTIQRWVVRWRPGTGTGKEMVVYDRQEERRRKIKKQVYRSTISSHRDRIASPHIYPHQPTFSFPPSPRHLPSPQAGVSYRWLPPIRHDTTMRTGYTDKIDILTLLHSPVLFFLPLGLLACDLYQEECSDTASTEPRRARDHMDRHKDRKVKMVNLKWKGPLG